MDYSKVEETLYSYAVERGVDFDILDEVGSGCFARVYGIRFNNSERDTVVKIVSTKNSQISGKRVIEYTDNEIEAMYALKDCEYTMDIYDHFYKDFPDGERIYLIFMPRLIRAADHLEGLPPYHKDRLFFTQCIARALCACHKHGILHRDVAIKNIYWNGKNYVLGDFGVCKHEIDAGTVIGSHVAPEIRLHQHLNGRFNSDIFSLGITSLYMLAHEEDVVVKIKDIVKEMLRNNQHSLVEIFQKATENDPAIRYQTAKELLDALDKYLTSLDSVKDKTTAGASDIEECVKAITNRNFTAAEAIAKKGYDTGNTRLSNLYAYILKCRGNSREALRVLASIRTPDIATEGLKAIISFRENKNDTTRKCILEAADKGFSVCEYFAGRWLTDGDAGFSKAPDKGIRYLYNAASKGNNSALRYFNKYLKNNTKAEERISPVAKEYFYVLDNMNKNLETEALFVTDILNAIANS